VLWAEFLASQRYGTLHAGHRTPGRTLWPIRFISRLYTLTRASPALDLTLHTRTPVTSISANGAGWTLHTPRGKTACGLVVHTTNAYAAHLIPSLPITPVRGQIAATRAWPNASLPPDDAFLLEDKYWFPRPAEEGGKGALVVIGAGHTVATVDDTVLERAVSEDLSTFLPRVFPGKFEAGADAEMEWVRPFLSLFAGRVCLRGKSGILGFTESGDPFVGPVDGAPGQFVVAGFSGHGMPRAFGWCARSFRFFSPLLTGRQRGRHRAHGQGLARRLARVGRPGVAPAALPYKHGWRSRAVTRSGRACADVTRVLGHPGVEFVRFPGKRICAC
jgi:glycine/D-amino acid oxidase-like deaminating enzyme